MKGSLTKLILLFAPYYTTASDGADLTAPWASTDPSCTFPPKSYITDVFEAMVNGSASIFYSHVIDDVSWRVMGTHPLAGHYSSKESFYNNTSVRLGKIEEPGGSTSLVRVVGGCDEEWSVEEMLGNVTMKNGMPFVNQYSWSTRWSEQGMIVEVRAYVDSALVTRAIVGNEPITDSDFMTERTVIYDGTY
ncbi:hypothetical protein F4779DRAFT_271619 [Xylariaceae sp. FL0662B]|nr:hypothetical protein F4779DRAFT_271619 [Xylariaceae sp. FL0662B]